MKEKGTVVEMTNSKAKVSLEASKACKTCSASHLCRPSGSARVIEVENRIGANTGDEVNVEISPKIGFLAVFLLFGLPILLGLVGLLFGNHYNEILSISLGFAGFATGLIIAKIINDMLDKKNKFRPKIVEIVKTKGS